MITRKKSASAPYKVIACIPPEKYDWRYAEGKFSFADIIRHLAAIERYMYAENAQLKPSRYPGHGRELADGPDNVLDSSNGCTRNRWRFSAASPPTTCRRNA